MNTKTPLALAFLMTASAAMAQLTPFVGPPPPGPSATTPPLFTEIQWLGQNPPIEPEAYTIDMGNGMVSDCNALSCGIPRKMTDAEKGTAKKEIAATVKESTNMYPGGKEDGRSISSIQAGMNDDPAPPTEPAFNPNGESVITVPGSIAKTAAESGYNYTQIREAAENSEALIGGGVSTFNDTANSSRRPDPPVDENYLGKVQFSPNE